MAQAVAQLRDADARLARVIDVVGPCTMFPTHEGSHCTHLVRAIVYQQLSGAAAGTIHSRLSALLGGVTDARSIATVPDDALRAVGLSTAKTRALRDLSERVLDGRLPLDGLEALDDQAIIDAVVQVRGIGPWTAQMFLMFRLGRPDVLPVLDLGVRKGAQLMHGLRSLPDSARLERLARPWRPWRSVASWYCWRALEL
jgi:DNA-3-methyladenine glycosylase II